MAMSWTQPCCEPCCDRRYPGRIPHRVIEPDSERCCLCGEPTRSGIYIRVDPGLVPHPTREKT